MSNRELIEYKESFISKVKKFIINLFKKDKEQNNYTSKRIINEDEKSNTNDYEFINEIKVNSNEVNIVIEKREFLNEIDGNREALNLLSIDRLKKLEAYYHEIIKQNEEVIIKLNKGNL